MVQTSVTAAPLAGLAGSVADLAAPINRIDAVTSEAAGLRPGLLVLRSSEGDNAACLPSAAVDDDAIQTAIATSASQQILGTGGTADDGVIAGGRISPPSKLTLIRSSHANQDAVAFVVAGLDGRGVPITETLTGADGGGDTLTTANFYSRHISTTIAAQSGTGGTTKTGVLGPTGRTLDSGDVLGFVEHQHRTKVTSFSSSDNEVFEDEMSLPLLRGARMFVNVENAFRAGDAPMIRLAANGGNTQLGSVRAHDADSGTCVPLPRATLRNTGTAGIGILEFWIA